MLQAQRTKRASSLNADRASRASAESPAQPDISKDWLVSGCVLALPPKPPRMSPCAA